MSHSGSDVLDPAALLLPRMGTTLATHLSTTLLDLVATPELAASSTPDDILAQSRRVRHFSCSSAVSPPSLSTRILTPDSEKLSIRGYGCMRQMASLKLAAALSKLIYH
ncbi:hypothetical protein RhiJN_04718 [Ceratobasidium sp. AG-Ba]|nr:hypothetical protein RhiJN_04718 [Ceratobasidium sp. AG-Ba]